MSPHLSRRQFLALSAVSVAGAATAAAAAACRSGAPAVPPAASATPDASATPAPTPQPTRPPAVRRFARDRFPQPGEWAGYRGNNTLDAWQPLAGRLTKPEIAWQQFVGAGETLVIAEPGPGAVVPVPLSELTPAEAQHPILAEPRWGLQPPIRELAGVRQPVGHTITVTYAHVLPHEPGLQRIEFESGFNKPTINGAWASAGGRLQAWRNGKWETVWESEQLPNLFHPLPIVGDFDADGRQEIAVLPWYELLIFDAETGKIKDRQRFCEGRAYGFLGVYDLNGDGLSEFVVQADYAKHVAVLGYKDGKLAVLWRKDIELGFGNPQKVLRVGPDPVADVDGDGKREVLINAYNDSGDGHWHVTVHDGMTGEVRADLVDAHLDALGDVNGDGASELLVTHTAGQGVPDYGPIAVYSAAGGTPRVLWESQDAGWQRWEPPQPEHVNSSATLANRTVLQRRAGGQHFAVVRTHGTENGEQQLRVMRWVNDGFASWYNLTGRYLEGLAFDDTGRLLARAITAPDETGQVKSVGATASLIASRQLGTPAATATVAHRPGAAPLIVVQSYGEELVSFAAPADGRAAEQRRWHGRGQSTSWPGQALGPILADLQGNGSRQVLYATSAPDGSARLAVDTLDGEPVWVHDFPRFPGSLPVWNLGGLILWQAAHFNDARAADVIVTLRRSIMHSDETYLLAGDDGRELWHRDHQLFDRGVGGQPFAIADYDGDGREEACSLYPDLFYILEGENGKEELTPKQGPYWGQPVAGDWLSTGSPSVFFATERASLTALYRSNGTLAWLDARDKSGNSLPACGDFDGDGQLEIIAFGYEDGVRCYDTAAGKVKWRMNPPAPGTPAGSASADVDSDGRDEALFVIDQTLYCIGTAGDPAGGELRWQVQLPVRAGPPVPADVDGDGQLSILLLGENGVVYCVH